jgi:hypothetical protein
VGLVYPARRPRRVARHLVLNSPMEEYIAAVERLPMCAASIIMPLLSGRAWVVSMDA